MTEQDRTAALAVISKTEAEANVARALRVFDALDDQSARLTDHDRYDAAALAWATCMDVDHQISDEDVTRLAIRAARHIPEEQLVDLIDVQFGDREKRIRIDAEHGLVWLPEDDCLILTYPAPFGGYVIDAVLMRTRVRA